MPTKDFQHWHLMKKNIHEKHPRNYTHEREIWFCYLGENIGYEQDGKGRDFLRPVIILKKFNHELAWIVPLTRQYKENHPYYFLFKHANMHSTAILSQLRLIDIKRLKYKNGTIKKSDFDLLKTKIRQLLV